MGLNHLQFGSDGFKLVVSYSPLSSSIPAFSQKRFTRLRIRFDGCWCYGEEGEKLDHRASPRNLHRTLRESRDEYSGARGCVAGCRDQDGRTDPVFGTRSGGSDAFHSPARRTLHLPYFSFGHEIDAAASATARHQIQIDSLEISHRALLGRESARQMDADVRQRRTQ